MSDESDVDVHGLRFVETPYQCLLERFLQQIILLFCHSPEDWWTSTETESWTRTLRLLMVLVDLQHVTIRKAFQNSHFNNSCSSSDLDLRRLLRFPSPRLLNTDCRVHEMGETRQILLSRPLPVAGPTVGIGTWMDNCRECIRERLMVSGRSEKGRCFSWEGVDVVRAGRVSRCTRERIVRFDGGFDIVCGLGGRGPHEVDGWVLARYDSQQRDIFAVESQVAHCDGAEAAL